MIVARLHGQLRGSRRMLFPQRLDSFIFFLPFRNSRPPKAENRIVLSHGTELARDGEHLSNSWRQLIGLGLERGSHAEAEPPQIVVLVVVAVPTAMALIELEF